MIFSCGMISTHYYCICILVLITLKWRHEWPKHVDDYDVIKITFTNSSTFVGPLKKCIHLINVWNVEHIQKNVKVLWHV